MIEKIKLDNPSNFLGPYAYHDEIAKKLNELITVVNRIDEQMQKLPPAKAIHEHLMDKNHE